MSIEWINYGIAYKLLDGTIQVNKVLKNDYKVLEEVLAHERRHSDGGHKFRDYLVDMEPISLRTQLFVLRHPSCWLSFIPFRYHRNKIMYDPSTILKYVTFILLVAVIIWLR